jgi:fermentation-respiration switch protein FrsA (DUF1100 family)
MPDGAARPPHDYGVAILLRAALPRLVPAAQLQPLDRALVAYLDASSLAAADPARAARLFDESAAISASLEAPARTIMQWVRARDVSRIGPLALPFVEEIGGDPALSPERSPLPAAPVFLVHGLDDNVIPSSETPQLAAHIAGASGPPVRWLLTPLISHADLQPAVPLRDVWRLVRIWTAIWAAFGRN